jgi:hypothetical protein
MRDTLEITEAREWRERCVADTREEASGEGAACEEVILSRRISWQIGGLARTDDYPREQRFESMKAGVLARLFI